MSKAPVPLYIRVSSEDQVQGSGLPIQLRDCKAAAEREGFAPGIVLADEGESAKTADRPQFLKLMEYIREHRPPAVIVWKLDRFARNSLDSQLFRAKLKEYGTRLISATEAIPDDYSGKLFADIISAIAEYDNSLRAERCRNGMVYRAQEGYWVSTPPLGYKSARTEDDKPTLVPDPEAAPIILEMFKMLANGETQVVIREYSNKQGLRSKSGKPVSKQTVSRLLSNPAYAGWLESDLVGPKRIRGKWEPIVPEAIFDKAQLRLRNGDFKRRASDDFPLRGLLSCPKCKKLVTASYSKGRGGTYAYYHCHECNGIRARCDATEEALAAIIDGLSIDPEILDVMEETLHRFVSKAFDSAKKEKERLEKRLRMLEEKMDRLVELRLSGGISHERYTAKYEKMDTDLLMARNDYNEADKEKFDVVAEFNRARAFLGNPGSFWRSADPERRHSVFPLIFQSGLTLHPPTKKTPHPRLEGATCPIWYTGSDSSPTASCEEWVEWLTRFRVYRLARKAS